MIRIQQLKLDIGHTEADLTKKIRKILHLKEGALLSYDIRKQSIDARKKPQLSYVYTVDVTVGQEKNILKKIRDKNVSCVEDVPYRMPSPGALQMEERPVIVGSGPAGLFCAYMLAEEGYRPLLMERGLPVEERIRDVEEFWQTGVLKPDSNVQFGEGGAGTFSDGKLNTLVKDSFGRNRKVLEIFVKHGASEEILYVNKPHIGTDVLMKVVKSMREHITCQGGEIRFHTQMTGLLFKEDCPEGKDERIICGIRIRDTLTGKESSVRTDNLILAIGHSARDTFEMLWKQNVPMEAKSFAVGVRVEHPQSMINESQYGTEEHPILPAAAYKLTEKLEDGRGVYTFCMCPGGYVVNASSEQNRLAVNGMSYHARDGKNANSAVIVTVSPEDYGGEGPLAGMAFQRTLEENAWKAGNGRIPVQLFGDFISGKISEKLGDVEPQMKGSWTFADVRGIFPQELACAIEKGIQAFDRKIPGYARKDAVLSGVESRTSSPVRIPRDENLESKVRGLYPCGEGAGYAGGITSAAMDGIRTAEIIVKKYQPFDKGSKGLRNF